MPVSSYVDTSLPFCHVGVRWQPDEVARIFQVATLHGTGGGSEAGLVYELIVRNQILAPLALIGDFAGVEVASGVNAISGEASMSTLPSSVSSKACSCRLTKTWS